MRHLTVRSIADRTLALRVYLDIRLREVLKQLSEVTDCSDLRLECRARSQVQAVSSYVRALESN